MRIITIDPVSLLERGDEMFSTDPFDGIVFEDPPEDVEWEVVETAAGLAECVWMESVETISVGLYRAMAEADALAPLLASAPNLRSLDVPHPSSIEGIADLELPSLSIVRIYCEGASEGDAALAALARRPRSLRELQIVGCAITEAAARTIASAKWPLEFLAFGSTVYSTDDLGTRGVMALANAASLSSLITLDLVATSIDDAAIDVLVSSPHLQAIQQLSLAENKGITDAGIERFATSSALRSLRELAIHQTSVTDRAIDILRSQRPDLDVGEHYYTQWIG